MEINERRKHKRFPAVKRLSEPVDISLRPPGTDVQTSVPGVIVDISASGMGIITFAPIEEDSILALNMELPAIGRTDIQAKVAWMKQKRGVYQIGLEFVQISDEIAKKLETMGTAFEECLASLSRGQTNVCHKECPCYMICDNPEKQ